MRRFRTIKRIKGTGEEENLIAVTRRGNGEHYSARKKTAPELTGQLTVALQKPVKDATKKLRIVIRRRRQKGIPTGPVFLAQIKTREQAGKSPVQGQRTAPRHWGRRKRKKKMKPDLVAS